MAGWAEAAMEKGLESPEVTRLTTLPPQQNFEIGGLG